MKNSRDVNPMRDDLPVGSELQRPDLNSLVASTNSERALLLCFRQISDENRRAVLLLTTALASDL